MAKALKTAAIVVGVAALAVVTGGAAAGLGLSLATTFVVGGAYVSAGALALGAAALSVGSALLTKKPSVTAAQTDRLFANVIPRAFRKTPLGSTALPVDVRYEEWSGKDQEYCDWIVEHASCAIDGVEEIWFDTEMAWSATTGPVGKYAGYFSIPNLILEGTTANAFTFGAGKWNAASARLVGCAYARWRFKVTGNSKRAESPFASGLPSRITVIGRGAKLYDPRRDSTVPGGSGPMRADDQSTWRFTADDGVVIGDNLPLQILRVVLGWRIRNPVTGAMLLATGSGVPPRRLRLPSWITSANIADELVNRSAGGQEARYHGAAVVSEGDDIKQTLDMLCAGCCGRFRDTQGKLSLDIAHNDLAAIATDDGLLDDDVIGGFTWDPDPGFDGIPNVIRGQYVDATTGSLYQLLDYPEVRIASPDGVDRVMTTDLGAVESPSQAQRIVKQILQRKLYTRKFTAPFDIRAWKYPVGSVLPFTFAPLGFVRVPFRVEAQELGQDGVCNMTLSFEHPAIYAWDKDDSAPVIAAEPIIYDASKNPLIQAIADAGTTADWATVSGQGKPADHADVTLDALDAARFSLVGRSARVGTETRRRFDPLFWTTNFPNTMMASVRAGADELRLDAVFHERSHLAGLIWESEDRWNHPTTAYDTNRDYRGCTLGFRLQLIGQVLNLSDVSGPVLTVEGRDQAGQARTWYVRLANAVQSGTDTDARILLDFDRLPGGFSGDDAVFAGDVDRMFLSLAPQGYGGSGQLDVRIEGALVLSNIVVSGNASMLVCGLGPGGLHRVRMTNGYDDTYNVAPARIVRNLDLLGYNDVLNHYVGMSHYFRWLWDGSAGRYIAEDVPKPLNTPCALWHRDLADRLHASGRRLILSLSYEMLDSFAPAAWRQMDRAGNPALTGWTPPSTLLSPCHAGAMDYLARVARQFCQIAADAGLEVHFQVGEPWYWIDFRSQTPCFYDPATTGRYTADTGRTAPPIDSMAAAMDADRQHFLDWLGVQLGTSVLDLIAVVRADHPAMTSYALLYLPQLLHATTPEVHRVNMPARLAYPALDILQLEDYDFVIDGRPDLSASGRAAAEAKLRYPRTRQQYFGGFALFRDTGQIWRNTTNAMAAADEYGVPELFVWAYTQVLRDGYVPLLRSAPPVGVRDLVDIDTGKSPQDGDILTFDGARRRWVFRQPPKAA